MNRIACIFAVMVALLAMGRSAAADDWMFHDSAYSYSPRRGVEFGPDRFSRGPYYTPQYGGFIRSGFRNLHGGAGGWGGWGGGAWDYSNHFESWWQVGGQYFY